MAESATSAKLTPMTREHDFQRDLLFMLADLGKVKGLDVKEALEAVYETEIHHGRLYPNLDTLVERGLVDKHENVPDRRTNSYELTARGLREATAHHEWEAECLWGSE